MTTAPAVLGGASCLEAARVADSPLGCPLQDRTDITQPLAFTLRPSLLLLKSYRLLRPGPMFESVHAYRRLRLPVAQTFDERDKQSWSESAHLRGRELLAAVIAIANVLAPRDASSVRHSLPV